ncbi:MAG: hypothetical protein UIM53_05630 [Acutalibacteraceae bacterium]|nr:hypothetical protein [Acutalibacteraceae bacterium]
MGKFFRFIITALSVISVFVVLFLVFFSDNLLAEDTSSNVITNSLKTVNITFDTDPLILSKTNLDLMAGVHATDENGENIIDWINASVIDEGDNKVVMYSVNKSDYKLEAFRRELQMENYNEPSISIKEEKYNCNINELYSYIRVLIASGKITADDGFGNDISSNIYIDPSEEFNESGTYDITLMIKNSFSDVAQKEISINLTGEIEKSKIILSPQTATIKKNSYFSPERYILSAIDNEGNDITDKIIYDSEVDVTTTGRYKVYYYIAGEEDKNKPVATLTVVVTE